MWKRIVGLFSGASRNEKVMEDAELIINQNRELICHPPRLPKPDPDHQLKCFDAVFSAYTTIAAIDPSRAIHALLEVEKIVKPNSQSSFWANAYGPLSTSLQKMGKDHREDTCKYILDHARKGKIADFIIYQADTYSGLITSPQYARNLDFIATFLSHAAPKTQEFLETFKPHFETFYAEGSDLFKLGLTKRLHKVCAPLNSAAKKIPLPEYVQQMRMEQIKTLLASTVTLYLSEEDAEYKQITNCLQELDTLKAADTHLLNRAQSGEKDVGNLSFYLYQLDLPASKEQDGTPSEPMPLYILGSRPKVYGNQTDGGKLKTILATTEVDLIAKTYSTLPYNAINKNNVVKLAKHFTPTQYLTPPLYAAKTQYIDSNYFSVPLPLVLKQSFQPVSQLTDETNGVDLSNVQLSHPPYRDFLSLQHDQ